MQQEPFSALRQQVREAAGEISRRSPPAPRVALILGTGLGGLANAIAAPQFIPYAEIPHFAVSTVPGHTGTLVFGTLGGTPVVAMQGRVHFYEGYTPAQIAFPVRVLRALGATVLIVTNSAGGMNPAYRMGDLMVLSDHLSLMAMAGQNPLIGLTESDAPIRFVDMLEAYDPSLRSMAQAVAGTLGFVLREGVYVQLAGPSFETRADIRFLQIAGADAVGMSTIPEVIVARQEGLRVLGISAITNTWSEASEISHAEVLAAADRMGPRFEALVAGIVARIT